MSFPYSGLKPSQLQEYTGDGSDIRCLIIETYTGKVMQIRKDMAQLVLGTGGSLANLTNQKFTNVNTAGTVLRISQSIPANPDDFIIVVNDALRSSITITIDQANRDIYLHDTDPFVAETLIVFFIKQPEIVQS